jgi:hypothetical protein
MPEIGDEWAEDARTNRDEDWVTKALFESRNRNTHLSAPHQEKILAVAHQHGWTYEEALNYVIGVGLDTLRSVEELQKTPVVGAHHIRFRHAQGMTTELVGADCRCGYSVGLTTAKAATEAVQKHIDSVADGQGE